MKLMSSLAMRRALSHAVHAMRWLDLQVEMIGGALVATWKVEAADCLNLEDWTLGCCLLA